MGLDKTRVGWSLINSNNQEVRKYGDLNNIYGAIPPVIDLPNGMTVHDLKENKNVQGYKLIPRNVLSNNEIAVLKSGETSAVSGGEYNVTYTYRDATVDELKDYAASERYKRETNGIDIVISGSTYSVSTTRESQQSIANLKTLMVANTSFTSVNLKTKSGFVSANSSQLDSVYNAISNHVQSLFNAEKTVSDGVDNSTITTYDDVISQLSASYND